MHFPEPIQQIRQVEQVQHAKGGQVTRVTMRLDNGHNVTFYELAVGDRVTICDNPEQAFAIVRAQCR